MSLPEAPIEEIAVIKKDGKLFVDAFDGSGENVVTTDLPISESGQARKLFKCSCNLRLWFNLKNICTTLFFL